MSIEDLQTKADLSRFIAQEFEKPDNRPAPLPFKNMRFGSATLVFSASTISANIEIAHGLGTTPSAIFGMSHGAPEPGKIPLCNAFSEDADSFAMNGEVAAAHTGSIGIFWWAVA